MELPAAAVMLSQLQRARGCLLLSLRERGGTTVLDRLRQQGCLKARFPRQEQGPVLDAVLLNTSGGITGGDELTIRVCVGSSARAIVTTQAAERFYRAGPSSPASLRTTLTVDPGADLAWLPQETILFNGCRANRDLDIDLAAGARFLGAELLLLGRAAMGETLDDVQVRDRIMIRIEGRLVFQDQLRLAGDVGARFGRTAVAAGGRALATILMVAPDAESLVEPLRSIFGGGSKNDEVEAGVTFWRGILLARLLSRDGALLRRKAIEALSLLRGGARMPRVWQS